jgi:uncharacterized membrane protein HdeD (DUF308 family)
MENNSQSKFFVIRIIDDYVNKVSGDWWIVFLTGVVAILLGISFTIWPLEALEVFAYFIGLIAILVGLYYIKNSFRIKRIGKNYEKVKENIKSNFQ